MYISEGDQNENTIWDYLTFNSFRRIKTRQIDLITANSIIQILNDKTWPVIEIVVEWVITIPKNEFFLAYITHKFLMFTRYINSVRSFCTYSNR